MAQLHRADRPWRWEKIEEMDESERAQKKKMIRKVRSILNRITPTNEDELTKEFMRLGVPLELKGMDWKSISEKDTILSQVVNIIIDKAVDEPKFCVLYSKICRVQIETEEIFNDNISNFRNYLLCNVQGTFSKDWNDLVKEKQTAIEIETDLQKRKELLEAKDKLRRKRMGYIRFIGYLYLHGVISIRIIHYCVVDLLKSVSETPEHHGYRADDDSVECALCLLGVVGRNVQEKFNRDPEYFPLDMTFETLEVAMPIVSPRTRFLILELIELRARGWVPRRAAEMPKTLSEIREEMRKEQIDKEKLRKLFELEEERLRKERSEMRSAETLAKPVAITRTNKERLAQSKAETVKREEADESPTRAKTSIDTSIAIDSFDDLSDQCSCPICHEIFDSTNFIPYILNCGHSFCKICTDKLRVNNVVKCSLCQTTTDVPEGRVLSTNYQLLGISEKVMNSIVEAKISCKMCDKKFSPDGICVCMKDDCDMFKQLLCHRCAIQGQHGGHVVNYDAKMEEVRQDLLAEVASICSDVENKKTSVVAKAKELVKVAENLETRLAEANIPPQIIAQIDSLTSEQDATDYRDIVNDLAKTLIDGCEAVEGAFTVAINTANQQFELLDNNEDST